MTDGQTFYAYMAAFYLWSCLRQAPRGSFAITQRVWKGWDFTHPVANLAGLGKAIFLAPLLPWPQSFSITRPGKSGKYVSRGSLSSNKRLLRLAQLATSDIRFLSLSLTLYFFLALPYMYIRSGDSPNTLLCITVCFVLMVLIGLRFFCVHKRIAPDARGDRYKHLLFACTMPWHSMRLADELFMLPRLSPSHPLLLAALSSNKQSVEFLEQNYRESLHKKKAHFTLEEFDDILISKNLFNPKDMRPAEKSGANCSSYCPCCLTTYTEMVDRCSECEDLRLIPFD